MKRELQAVTSAQKDLEKVQKSLAKHTELLAKNREKAIELNCLWTLQEWRARSEELCKRHPNQFMIPYGEDDDLITKKQADVWWKVFKYTDDVEEDKKRLSYAEKSLAKALAIYEGKAEEYQAMLEETEHHKRLESAWLSFFSKTPEERQKEYEEWLKQFKADCLKDGVVIDEASHNFFNGYTKMGKYFSLYINDGITQRSSYCYTLRIDGELIFTSGEFATAYIIIKR